jgi:hypothetical protein
MQGKDPKRNGRTFVLHHQEKGAHHTGRLTRGRAKDRIAVHHDAVHIGEIKILEFQEDLPNGCRL